METCGSNFYLFAEKGVRIVCYYPYYAKNYDFMPNDMDPKLCTHIIYVYVKLDDVTLTMTSIDKSIDFDEGLY